MTLTAQDVIKRIGAAFPTAGTLSPAQLASCLDLGCLEVLKSVAANERPISGLRKRSRKWRAPVASLLDLLAEQPSSAHAAQAARAKAREVTQARRQAVEIRQRQRSRIYWFAVISLIEESGLWATLDASTPKPPGRDTSI